MFRDIKKVLLRGVITGMIGGLILFGFTMVLIEGLNREAKRQEAVAEYNCKHYGAAINKHYGRTVCAQEVM